MWLVKTYNVVHHHLPPSTLIPRLFFSFFFFSFHPPFLKWRECARGKRRNVQRRKKSEKEREARNFLIFMVNFLDFITLFFNLICFIWISFAREITLFLIWKQEELREKKIHVCMSLVRRHHCLVTSMNIQCLCARDL